MADEESEKKFEALMETQINAEARANRMEETIALALQLMRKSDDKIDILADFQAGAEARISRLEEAFAMLVQLARIADERIDTTDEKVEALNEKFDAMMEAHKNTEERLNAFIAVLERYMAERRNGKSQE
ncbi:MAG: hypothetical protein L0229_11665 [Blastocatellia bacterium]|nr:hypothetical protein [Blastocatellia bacterium]